MFRRSLKFGKNRTRVKNTFAYVSTRVSNVNASTNFAGASEVRIYAHTPSWRSSYLVKRRVRFTLLRFLFFP
jgi:hypothetical protein